MPTDLFSSIYWNHEQARVLLTRWVGIANEDPEPRYRETAVFLETQQLLEGPQPLPETEQMAELRKSFRFQIDAQREEKLKAWDDLAVVRKELAEVRAERDRMFEILHAELP